MKVTVISEVNYKIFLRDNEEEDDDEDDDQDDVFNAAL